jgi:hypothetical protein
MAGGLGAIEQDRTKRIFLHGGSGGASNLMAGYICWRRTAPDVVTIEVLLDASNRVDRAAGHGR